MRKLFLILFLAFPLLYPLAAQTEEVNEQYELFSWEPVARAKQYGVTVEKYDASTDTWSEYKSVKTTETQLEILFTPGTFRVSISTYNLMGRKGKSSDWVTFKILEEGQSALSKEENGRLAMRQEKFIQSLENALIRINNGTYGVCRVTGKLIPKERLRVVPHATLSVEGKLMLQEREKRNR